MYTKLQVLELKVEFGVSTGNLNGERKYLNEAYSLMKEDDEREIEKIEKTSHKNLKIRYFFIHMH